MSAGTNWDAWVHVTWLSGKVRFVPAATNSEKYTTPFSTSSCEAMEAHLELKSSGAVSVEHDEGSGLGGDATARDALSSAAHADCSNFISDGNEKVESCLSSE